MNLSPEKLEAVLRELPAPVTAKLGGIRWEVRSAALREMIGDLLAQPEVTSTSDVVHQSWLVTLTRVVAGEGVKSWLMRRSNYAKTVARQRDLFRAAASVRAFRNALALEAAGIPTPRVLAAGVRRELLVPQAGYLLAEEIPAAVSLAQLTTQSAPIDRGVVKAVAAAIANLHQRGFIHGDLTINNVLLDGAAKPWFIDLERMRKVRGEVSWAQAVEDFHRFARHFGKFSPAGKRGALRLLQSYCRARGWAGREREFAEALGKRLKHKIEDARTQ